MVAALVKDLTTPPIAAIVEKPDFSAISSQISCSNSPIGDLINAMVSSPPIYCRILSSDGAKQAGKGAVGGHRGKARVPLTVSTRKELLIIRRQLIALD